MLTSIRSIGFLALVLRTEPSYSLPRTLRAGNADSHRRLSFESIAGYFPGSQVTDHNAIDLDQNAMEGQLAKDTDAGFDGAKSIYENGGHSKSFATVTLTNDTGLVNFLAEDTEIKGKNANGIEVVGKAMDNYNVGAKQIKIQYKTTDVQDSYVGCQVGGLADVGLAVISGCFADGGELEINKKTYNYEYTILEDNKNKRTIKGFSTGAKGKMYDDCPGCPYQDYKYFYNYYGAFDYSNLWVTAALDGTNLVFPSGRGNADFRKYTLVGRREAVKKGTAYMVIFMYVIREFEDALDDCTGSCINCNDGSVHAWDEGVAFYTGSLEGTDGKGEGKLLYGLADKRCENYKTCGTLGNADQGTSKLNYDLSGLFALGQHNLLVGNCNAARNVKDRIAQLMYVPLIQGTLRYAYKVEFLQEGEKGKAEGATFAAAVLPKLYDVDRDAAQVVYDNMRVGATSTSFAKVKNAFEKNYLKMGISCDDVGGLIKSDGSYYAGASPCVDPDDLALREAATKSDNDGGNDKNIVGIVLGSVAGAIAVFALVGILYMRKRERAGNPVFETTKQIS